MDPRAVRYDRAMPSPYAGLPGFDTAEAAAMSTFPPQHVPVVSSCSNGRDAFVLLGQRMGLVVDG